MTREFHLAQANVARMRAPLEDPLMEGFRFSAYGSSLVLWWLPAGRLPSVGMAVEKLEPAPGEAQATPPEVDAEFCGGAARSGIP
jgi:hypothetical protein